MQNRLYDRVVTHLGVFVKPFNAGYARAWIRDVSIGGLRVAAPALRRNTLVEIVVPHRVGMVSWIGRFKAQVIWVDDDEVGLMTCEDDFETLVRMKAALIGANMSQDADAGLPSSNERAFRRLDKNGPLRPLLPKHDPSMMRK